MKINRKKSAVFCLPILPAACASGASDSKTSGDGFDDQTFAATAARISDADVNSAEPSVAAALAGSKLFVSFVKIDGENRAV